MGLWSTDPAVPSPRLASSDDEKAEATVVATHAKEAAHRTRVARRLVPR
eukprot:CAMPEP_0119388296 /NCGR_PEP_ID=MMETSP1334-20130426/104369_1 /TAXON_ID=127549 /ORGANISM="Calcidiscus leptoporus, Strain RCC1130" /LENGTH=48 /DNA_ID= /DNA_START= /DNA_END= /DNA_ORIENTATION=